MKSPLESSELISQRIPLLNALDITVIPMDYFRATITSGVMSSDAYLAQGEEEKYSFDDFLLCIYENSYRLIIVLKRYRAGVFTKIRLQYQLKTFRLDTDQECDSYPRIVHNEC
jgi:hypothetical protein